MIAHIDHVNISVQDVARSVHFYSELLGFEKTTDAHLEGDWIKSNFSGRTAASQMSRTCSRRVAGRVSS